MIAKFFIERPVLANVLAILMVVIGAVALYSPAGGAISRRGAADRSGHDALSRRQRPHCDRHRGAADRAAGQRRRGHDLHAVVRRRRRQLYADGDLQDRHRSRTSRRCWCRTGCRARCRRCRRRCRSQGVNVQKKSTAILQIVTLTSPEQPLRQPVSRQLRHHPACKDEIARLPGVGNVTVFGAGQYSMRVWLDPEKMQARGLTTPGRGPGAAAAEPAGHRRPDRHAAGTRRPVLPVHHQRRGPARRCRAIRQRHRQDRQRRRDHAACATSAGSNLAPRPMGRCSRWTASRRRGSAIFQSPGANALEVAGERQDQDDGAGARISAGLAYAVPFDTTKFVSGLRSTRSTRPCSRPPSWC